MVRELTPAGSLTLVSHIDALIRRLDVVMHPGLRYRLVSEIDGEQVRSQEIDVSEDGENNRWLPVPVTAAVHRLDVSAGWPMDQKLELRAGEAMLLRLYGAAPARLRTGAVFAGGRLPAQAGP